MTRLKMLELLEKYNVPQENRRDRAWVGFSHSSDAVVYPFVLIFVEYSEKSGYYSIIINSRRHGSGPKGAIYIMKKLENDRDRDIFCELAIKLNMDYYDKKRNGKSSKRI